MSTFFLFLLIFLFLVFVLSLIIRYESPESKGRRGELYVNKYACRKLDNEIYYVLQNVTLKSGDGSTQIDHVIISKYGVFVIETKNMSGWIFGSERQSQWTQTFRTGKKQAFQNPIRQNYKHVRTLKNMFRLKNNQIHSVIVFTGKSEFKTNMPDNVTEGLEFIDYIESKIKSVLTDNEVDYIIQNLEDVRLEESDETDRAHVKYIESIK